MMKTLLISLLFSTLALGVVDPVDTNIKQVGGVDVTTGSGASSTGTQRVILATDQPTIPVTATVSGTPTVNQGTSPWVISGTVMANAGTNLNTSALALAATQTDKTQFTRITDGTNDGSIKAASTAATAADTSFVVALSPNSPLPTGSNTIGALIANQTINLSQIAGTPTSAGAGTADSGTLRVVLPSDQTPIPATQSGAWTVQQGTPPWQVVGNVAHDAADSGNPLKIGAKYNATLPTVINGDRVDAQADANGRIFTNSVPVDGAKFTYSAAANSITTVASPTDVCTLTGSPTRTIRVNYVMFSGTTTSGSGISSSVQLIKRSTANTGGTSTVTAAVPHDVTNDAATATARSYTANPTLGATVGNIRAKRHTFQAAAVGVIPLIWDFGQRPGQTVVLRGVNEVLSVNLNATTITGGLISCSFEWTEEP
jgi:hypothetical protein